MAGVPKGVIVSALPASASCLSWLCGTWRCESASGTFPGINDFNYGEELSFVSVGQPMLNYKSFSWHAEKKTPMHQEAGFLRVQPGTNHVALMVAHNFGVTTLEEGEVKDRTLKLQSCSIGRMSFSGETKVLQVVREFSLEDDKLKQVSFMETTKTPLSKHLEAVYVKIE